MQLEVQQGAQWHLDQALCVVEAEKVDHQRLQDALVGDRDDFLVTAGEAVLELEVEAEREEPVVREKVCLHAGALHGLPQAWQVRKDEHVQLSAQVGDCLG